MIRRPPRSTLVPNTTLSRSLGVVGDRRAGCDAQLMRHEVATLHHPEGDLPAVTRPGALRRPDPVFIPLDRKSTRLNTSHPNILHDAFNLKKLNFSSIHWLLT